MTRRLVATALGEPDQVLRLVDLPPDPSPGPEEVVIEVHAVGLNFLDVSLCRGDYATTPVLPLTPGVEACGTVVAAGPGAEYLLSRNVLACPTFPRGALGTQVTVAADLVVERPSWLDPVTCAALPVTYQTAWFALERARVRHAERVLVLAGAGGVGTAVTQLAVARGAQVIAVASTPDKRRLCLGQGATTAVDYADLAALEPGVDVVIDPVTGGTCAQVLPLVRPEGRIVAIGRAGGPGPGVDPAALMAANVDLIGLSWGSTYPHLNPQAVRAAYRALFEGYRDGTVLPHIQRVVGLAEAPMALADLAARRTAGKIVVTPDKEH